MKRKEEGGENGSPREGVERTIDEEKQVIENG